jgi:hypothetical protein
MKIGTLNSSETLSFHRTTWLYKPEDSALLLSDLVDEVTEELGEYVWIPLQQFLVT